jgi:hypothetical protein
LSCHSHMKKILCIFFSVASLTVFSQRDPEGFVLVKSDPPFEVHERWVEFPGKTPAVTSRELKSEFTTYATIYEVLALIKNEDQAKAWQSHIAEYKIYHRPDTNSWDVYSRHDVPWPVSDQDFFMEYKMTEVRPDEELHINFKSRVDHKLAPVRNDANRVELIGSWKIVQMSPEQVKVTYRIQSVPGTNLPRMIIDPVIRNNILSSIKSLKELAE